MSIDTKQSIFSELANFIVSQPTLEEIIAYRASSETNERLHQLLEMNREDGLSPDERKEINDYLAISHLMTLAKAKARLKLADQS